MGTQAKPAHSTGSHSDGRYQRLFHLCPQIFGVSPKELELSFMTAYAFVIHFLEYFLCATLLNALYMFILSPAQGSQGLSIVTVLALQRD